MPIIVVNGSSQSLQRQIWRPFSSFAKNFRSRQLASSSEPNMIAVRLVLLCVVFLAVAGQGFAQEVETRAQPSIEAAGIFQLHVAAEQGDAAAIKKLVGQGAQTNIRNDRGLTALHYAAHHQHFDAIVELIRGGANPNIQDVEGWTPLMIAAATNDLKVIHVLLEGNADPLLHSKDGLMAHHRALERGHTAAASLIVHVGLVRAIQTSDYYAMFLMLDAGANVNTQNQQGATALIVAAHEGQSNVVQRLLTRRDIRVDFQEKDGWSAMMFAAYKNHARVVSMLLDHGVDLNLRNARGQTALDIAEQFGAKECAQILRERIIYLRQAAAHQEALKAQSSQDLAQAAQPLVDLKKAKETVTIQQSTTAAPAKDTITVTTAKSDAKPATKEEVKSEVKNEVKSDPKAGSKSDVKADAKAEVKTDAKSDTKTDVKTDNKDSKTGTTKTAGAAAGAKTVKKGSNKWM